MAFVYFDRVKESSTSTGTGNISLGGAVTAFRTFSSVYSNSDTMYYVITDQNGANWEVGLGTYVSSGNQLVRTTVTASSNTGSHVNFTSASLYVFTTFPAAALAQTNSTNGYTTLPGNLILQWGQGSTSSGSGSTTFPITFPNAVYSIQISADINNSPAPYITLSSTSGFSWSQGNTSPSTLFFIAIGS